MGHELSSSPNLPEEPNDDDDAISEHSQLLVDARPALLGTDALSRDQQRLDERIRTLCLVVMALAVCAAALHYLEQILVRFVLALALKYLLTPLIDLVRAIRFEPQDQADVCSGTCAETRWGRQLSVDMPLLPNASCRAASCRCKLPRGLAILVALALAIGGLAVLGIVVARSIGEFATHSDSCAPVCPSLPPSFACLAVLGGAGRCSPRSPAATHRSMARTHGCCCGESCYNADRFAVPPHRS